MTSNIVKLTLQQLLTYGVHLGYFKNFLHRDLKPYLLGFKGVIHIFNLKHIRLQLRLILQLVVNVVALRQYILLVNHEQAVNIDRLPLVRRLQSVDGSWIGGFLTNHKKVKLASLKKTKIKKVQFPVFPSVVFFLNSDKNNWGFKECINLNIPTGVVTGSSFNLLHRCLYPLPGNCLSYDVLNFYAQVVQKAVSKGLIKEQFNIFKIKSNKWVNI